MTVTPDVATVDAGAFVDVMARQVSCLAVVTARQADGDPCGLLVSSFCSYSVDPPSMLVSIGAAARCYPTMATAGAIGLHLLATPDERVAQLFARPGADRFTGTRWGWDDGVPRLAGVGTFLACAVRRVVEEGDHAVLFGEVTRVVHGRGEPLLHHGRRMGWRLVSR